VINGSGVCTNLFDPETISHDERERLRKELNVPVDTLLVTMISRLIRSKGVMEFGAAARTLRRSQVPATFLLVGPIDVESTDRVTEAELSQLEDCVTWAGARDDIPIVLGISDIFVLPSFYREGIPRVLLEAASMALPIVTTDSPGCREVVEHGVNGLTVAGRDPDALSQAILHLMLEPEIRRRFGEKSREHVAARYDLARIADKTRSVYQELLAHRGISAERNCDGRA
jgi:glycosyltransferase involved in cell wall biosynthesis